jgi:hypothetical protein
VKINQHRSKTVTPVRPQTVALVALGLIAAVAVAQIPALSHAQPAPGTPAAPANPNPPYRVGMGEVMAFGVQPRHLKTAIAAQAGDWAYTSYAWKELGESFERIPRAIPNYRGQPTTDLFARFVKEPMAALDQAIRAGDMARFKTAYAELTQGCNGCHQLTDRAMVVIKVPDQPTAYADQDFKPTKP